MHGRVSHFTRIFTKFYTIPSLPFDSILYSLPFKSFSTNLKDFEKKEAFMTMILPSIVSCLFSLNGYGILWGDKMGTRSLGNQSRHWTRQLEDLSDIMWINLNMDIQQQIKSYIDNSKMLVSNYKFSFNICPKNQALWSKSEYFLFNNWLITIFSNICGLCNTWFYQLMRTEKTTFKVSKRYFVSSQNPIPIKWLKPEQKRPRTWKIK